jgi:hypothetical protein
MQVLVSLLRAKCHCLKLGVNTYPSGTFVIPSLFHFFVELEGPSGEIEASQSRENIGGILGCSLASSRSHF